MFQLPAHPLCQPLVPRSRYARQTLAIAMGRVSLDEAVHHSVIISIRARFRHVSFARHVPLRLTSHGQGQYHQHEAAYCSGSLSACHTKGSMMSGCFSDSYIFSVEALRGESLSSFFPRTNFGSPIFGCQDDRYFQLLCDCSPEQHPLFWGFEQFPLPTTPPHL